MEEATELGNYLPISFKTRSEQEYIAFSGMPLRPITHKEVPVCISCLSYAHDELRLLQYLANPASPSKRFRNGSDRL